MADVVRRLEYRETIDALDPLAEIRRCLEQFESLGGDLTECVITVTTDQVEQRSIFDRDPEVLNGWTHLHIEGRARP